jgi:hypothetical protein
VWDALKYEWDERITLLVKYKQREEHCNVPKDHKEDGKNLGTWLNTQRLARNNGNLDTIKENRLVELGVLWEPQSEQWDENITLLVKYKQREGHCNVHTNHKEDGKNLGQWLGTQRTNKKNKTLDNVKINKLEELGVVWGVLEYQWDENITLLVKFKQREGHCNVLLSHIEDKQNLGKWLYRQKNIKLSEVRQERLRKIGVIF